MAQSPLTEVLTIPEVAARAGWHPKRMWRHLKSVNEQVGGMLLRNVSRGNERPRWTVTMGALKVLHPQWFFDPETMQTKIESLEEENAELRNRVVTLERRVFPQLQPTG